jgi:NADPH:quinone reductase-like Zn-dependent oxidoreductase
MNAALRRRPEQAPKDELKMTAITQRRYGIAPEEVLRLGLAARPLPKDDEVLIRVRAAGVDRGSVHLMTGQPYLMRVIGFGFRGPKVQVPGMAVAGTVEAVGLHVTQLRPGDDVFGMCRGSFAQYATARQDRLVVKPPSLTFEQAAALANSGTTALQAVRDQARLVSGQHVLIIGASGGVGTFAVQLAKAYGAEVTGACSTAKMDLVLAIGADHVIDYTRTDITAGQQRYDTIIDIGGSRPVSKLRRVLVPQGTLVVAGGENGGAVLGDMSRSLRAQLLSPFVSQRLTGFLAMPRRADLTTLADLAVSGAITPAVERGYPLSEAPAAMRHLVDGRARGMVVITI